MIVIRKAEPRDAYAVAHVHVTSWRETYQGIVPDEFLKNLSIERRAVYWKNSLENPGDEFHHVLAAEVDGSVVGFVNYGKVRDEVPGFSGELFAIYILRSAQKLGLGRRLFAEAVREQLKFGRTSMLLWVLSDNPSRGFYEHLGGEYLKEKVIEIGGKELNEAAYGWRNLNHFQGG